MTEKIQIAELCRVFEPEPGVVEIDLETENGTSRVLRMNLITFLKLWAGIKHLASPADPLSDGSESPAETTAT